LRIVVIKFISIHLQRFTQQLTEKSSQYLGKKMGGIGSGYTGRPGGKGTTEGTRNIDINRWRKKGKWKYESGITSWSTNGKKTAAINFRIIAEQNEIILSWVRNGIHESQTIRLYRKPQPYGKCRYYFICGNCHTLRSKLYESMPFYICRVCRNLTYQSCNESHQFDRLGRLIGMTPEGMRRYMNEDKENELYMRSDLKTRRRLDKKKAKRDAKYSNDIRSYFR